MKKKKKTKNLYELATHVCYTYMENIEEKQTM